MYRILLSIALASSAANAGVVLFSNFGPAMAFNTGAAQILGGSSAFAMQFTPSITAPFSDAGLAVSLVGAGVLSVSLDADNADLPGAVLEQMSVSGPVSTGVLTATSILNPVLQAGTPYWLVANYSGPALLSSWFWNSTGDHPLAPSGHPAGSDEAISGSGSSGPWVYVAPGSTLGGTSVARDAFQIDGVSSAPEPTSVASIALGLGLLLLKLRSRASQS